MLFYEVQPQYPVAVRDGALRTKHNRKFHSRLRVEACGKKVSVLFHFLMPIWKSYATKTLASFQGFLGPTWAPSATKRIFLLTRLFLIRVLFLVRCLTSNRRLVALNRAPGMAMLRHRVAFFSHCECVASPPSHPNFPTVPNRFAMSPACLSSQWHLGV